MGDIVMQDRVIAAASIKVPASMRSGIMEYSESCNFLLPLISSLSVPAPSTHAPVFIRKWARSITSGSCDESIGCLSSTKQNHFGRCDRNETKFCSSSFDQKQKNLERFLISYLSYIRKHGHAISHTSCHHKRFSCPYAGVIKSEPSPHQSFSIWSMCNYFPIPVMPHKVQFSPDSAFTPIIVGFQ